MKKYIVPFFIAIIMILLGIFYMYKYANYPIQSAVHCFIKKIPENEYFYTIEDEYYKSEYTFAESRISSSESIEKLKLNAEKLNQEHKGYLQDYIKVDNGIVIMTYYDYDLLSNDDLTVIKDYKSIHDRDFDKATDLKIYKKGLTTRFGEQICQ